MDDERVPVLVGCGRHTERAEKLAVEDLPSPLALLQRAVDLALADLGLEEPSQAATVARDADAFATVNLGPVGIPPMAGGDGVYHNIYPNPPLTLAKAYGAQPQPSKLFSSLASGHAPQLSVNVLAELVGRGEVKVAVIAGCEFMSILKKAGAAGYQVTPPTATPGAATASAGSSGGKRQQLNWGDSQVSRPQKPGLQSHHKLFTKTNVHEEGHAMSLPVNVYPMYEQALRRLSHMTVEEHMREVSTWWAAFSEVAAEAPAHSWFPTRRSALEIQEPRPPNRYVGYPYTKYHCSVIDVDQSAALVMMSVAEARRRAVPEEKWVYLHGCSEVLERDTIFRKELHRSRAMEVMGRQCFHDANVSAKRIDQFDIYSCFPSAVGMAVRELGIPLEQLAQTPRRFTLTGGLAFHGGPGANYAMHSIAAMMEHLRAHRGDFGMVTANGGFLAKHAAGVYSTTPYSVTHPSARAWSRSDPAQYQAELDAVPDWPVAAMPEGDGVVESYTVIHNQRGPTQAICLGLLSSGPCSGHRFVAISRDSTLLARYVAEDQLGTKIWVRHDAERRQNVFGMAADPPDSMPMRLSPEQGARARL